MPHLTDLDALGFHVVNRKQTLTREGMLTEICGFRKIKMSENIKVSSQALGDAAGSPRHAMPDMG